MMTKLHWQITFNLVLVLYTFASFGVPFTDGTKAILFAVLLAAIAVQLGQRGPR